MLRIALLDDHPAVLAGLCRLIEPQRDLTVIAAAPTAAELARRLDGARADVLVLDYDLKRGDGLSHCQRIKRRSRPPAVIIYSAYSSHALALAARAAGADAVVDKAEPVERLLAAIRAAADGELAIPAVSRDAYQGAVAKLDDDDLPVLAMLLDGASLDAIAQALRIHPAAVSWRAQRIVGRLRPRVRAGTGHDVGAARGATLSRSGSAIGSRCSQEPMPDGDPGADDDSHVDRIAKEVVMNGQSSHQDGGSSQHVGRFSEGIEQLPETPSKLRMGRFSQGSERLREAPRKLHRGRYSEGIEQLPETPSKLRRGSFADGYERAA